MFKNKCCFSAQSVGEFHLSLLLLMNWALFICFVMTSIHLEHFMMNWRLSRILILASGAREVWKEKFVLKETISRRNFFDTKRNLGKTFPRNTKVNRLSAVKTTSIRRISIQEMNSKKETSKEAMKKKKQRTFHLPHVSRVSFKFRNWWKSFLSLLLIKTCVKTKKKQKNFQHFNQINWLRWKEFVIQRNNSQNEDKELTVVLRQQICAATLWVRASPHVFEFSQAYVS